MDIPARPRVYLVVVLLTTFDLPACVHSQNCGSLTDPGNGQVNHNDGTTFGHTATYSCNTGYNLVGDSTRTCQATGVWSGSAPTCQVVDCRSLTDPANGKVTHSSGTTFGNTATYSCNTGYNLVGDSTRTCQATGVWSGSAPTCQDCGSLTDPANGQVNHNDGTTFGHTATYSCNTGYNLVGDSTRTCQATGVWSGSAPTCQVVDCRNLTDPANGSVTHTSGTFGHTATYSCNTGYNLVGDSTRTCQATGQWSGSAPTCQFVDCRNLTDPANGNVTHSSGTTFQQTATYSCNTGYNLVGDSTRTCQATGQWSGSEPTCQGMDCGNLTDPGNGSVTHTGTTFGQTATYRCNTGYTLVGDSTRTCQATRVWSGSAPTCQIVDCGSLNASANGQVNHTTGTTFGQNAIYSCNTGYNLVGNSTRTCQDTGGWSGSAPTCQVVDCGSLNASANGQVNHTSGTTFGQNAIYSCNTGYNLVGNSTRTCQDTGNWSGSAPTCQVVVCGDLTDPANGNVTHTSGTTFEHAATYSCNTGYTLVGDSIRTCQATGRWSGSAPTCQIVDCGSLNASANGQVNHTSGTTFRQPATYSCNTGYNLVGHSTRTCQATGNWSGSAPTCQIVDCGSLNASANGQVNHTSGTTFGQNAIYSCNTGYNLVGNSTHTCQDTGNWSGSAPTCQVVDCGDLTDPANGNVTHTSGTTFRQTATYSCNTGYNLVGDSSHTCQATGQWSGSAPTCQIVDCGSLNGSANDQVNYTAGTKFGQNAIYSCNTGYNLVGDSTRTCQATEVWSGSAPTCRIVGCSNLTDPANGQVNHTAGTTFGLTATYSCNTGYNLVGDSIRTCQATGNWSGSAPTCEASTPEATTPYPATTSPQTVGTITKTGTAPVSSSIQPTNNSSSDGATTTSVVTAIQPTNNSPSDGATTTSVVIVVAVVIILVIVVGVVCFVILLRRKKRKQRLVINKVQSVKTDFEMKLEQVRTTEMETTSTANQPPYAEIQTKAPPKVPTKSEELIEYLNLKSTLTGGYSEIELEQADSKHALPAKPPRHINLCDPTSQEMQSCTVHQDIDQHSSTTNVPEADIYTVPDTTNSHTVETQNGNYEAVYSEPIEPSLFTEAVRTPADSEDLQSYGPIYTIPINLPKSMKVLPKVSGSNIREICELGMGNFGKVILAETVGLSAKDLKWSKLDDDKSKSTLVAVKTLKTGAPSTIKEAFEKEVNFMSRLTNKNVIRILGVCYEDTPFIMMEYMEKGDLNQYLQKFKTLSMTDSEPQGQITISTLVHMTTQIASAMKYLTSHNYVHRDLATRNCLVGPNYLVKISDFGMSRSLYDSHYYHIHGRCSLPVRWMAFECFYGNFSQKSDVWAFGVTMWEIFTLAKEQPYNDMSDEQLIEDALKGKNRTLLARPDLCPLEVYIIMLKCWIHNSKQRAAFDELFQLLTSVHQDV